ncbi:MAG: SMC-Scp complex subunit ScpB [Planctomycetota bacterium]
MSPKRRPPSDPSTPTDAPTDAPAGAPADAAAGGPPAEGVPGASDPAAADATEPAAGDLPASDAPVGDDDAAGGDEPGEGDEGDGGRRRAKKADGPPPPPERLEGAVEALLLAAGEALTAERIRDLLGLPSALHVKEAVEAIRTRWKAAGLAVEIQDVAGGHRVVTRPEYAEYVRRLWRRPAADRLSATLLETLSIVAYKQPVARAEIERIRGVQCGEALRQLLERRLLKVSGRSDQPGRPLLYATTVRFLEVFGLAGLEDLPNAKDLARL